MFLGISLFHDIHLAPGYETGLGVPLAAVSQAPRLHLKYVRVKRQKNADKHFVTF